VSTNSDDLVRILATANGASNKQGTPRFNSAHLTGLWAVAAAAWDEARASTMEDAEFAAGFADRVNPYALVHAPQEDK